MRPLPRAKPGEINYPFVDRFTLVHACIGVAYGALDLTLLVALALALAWEFVENPLKAYLPALFPHATRDTLRNAAGDFLAVMGGWAVVRYVSAG